MGKRSAARSNFDFAQRRALALPLDTGDMLGLPRTALARRALVIGCEARQRDPFFSAINAAAFSSMCLSSAAVIFCTAASVLAARPAPGIGAVSAAGGGSRVQLLYF